MGNCCCLNNKNKKYVFFHLSVRCPDVEVDALLAPPVPVGPVLLAPGRVQREPVDVERGGAPGDPDDPVPVL